MNSEEKKGESTSWKEIQEKLSYQMNADAKKKRDTLFKDFDTNGNGFLSLAEIDKGIQDFLKLPEVKSLSLSLGSAVHTVIEYILNTKHFNKTLTYCGFRKPHPHIDLCIIRLAFKEPITDMGKIVIYLIDAADDAVAIYKKISESFAQKK
jgi:hypothetical protein